MTVANDDYRQVVTVTNRSGQVCTLRGMPAVVLVQKSGSEFSGGHQDGGDGTTGTPPPDTVELRPQASASFAIDLGRQQVADNHQYCQPVAGADGPPRS